MAKTSPKPAKPAAKAVTEPDPIEKIEQSMLDLKRQYFETKQSLHIGQSRDVRQPRKLRRALARQLTAKRQAQLKSAKETP